MLFDAGRIEESFEICREIERVKPSAYRARQCIAAAHMQRGDFESALPYLRLDAHDFPGEAPMRYSLLKALFATGRLDEVESHLERWQGHFGESPELVQAWVELRRRRGQLESPATVGSTGRSVGRLGGGDE